MNRFVLFFVVLSIAFNVIVAEDDENVDETSFNSKNLEETGSSSENLDQTNFGTDIVTNIGDSAESMTESVVGAGQQLYSAGEQMTQEQEEELTEAMNEMITYFTKSIDDMSSILENTRNVTEENSETVTADLVDNLTNYVQDTEMMRQQMGRVMKMRAQFQDSVLNQLNSMPISAEDAEKLESDLRERIQNQAGKMSGNMQNFINPSQIPQISHMSQMSQIPQRLARFGCQHAKTN